MISRKEDQLALFIADTVIEVNALLLSNSPITHEIRSKNWTFKMDILRRLREV